MRVCVWRGGRQEGKGDCESSCVECVAVRITTEKREERENA